MTAGEVKQPIKFIWAKVGFSGTIAPILDYDYVRGVYFEQNGKPRANGSPIIVQEHDVTPEEAALGLKALEEKYPLKSTQALIKPKAKDSGDAA